MHSQGSLESMQSSGENITALCDKWLICSERTIKLKKKKNQSKSGEKCYSTTKAHPFPVKPCARIKCLARMYISMHPCHLINKSGLEQQQHTNTNSSPFMNTQHNSQVSRVVHLSESPRLGWCSLMS